MNRQVNYNPAAFKEDIMNLSSLSQADFEEGKKGRTSGLLV